MKISVSNGSPKKDKSNKLHITQAFPDGMKKAAPQEIQTINDGMALSAEICSPVISDGTYAGIANGNV